MSGKPIAPTHATLLHESEVTPDEIDSLGHMNVRFYIARVVQANAELLKRAGLYEPAAGNQRIRQADTYTRFHKEQFEGASLHTLGGFVESSSAGLLEGPEGILCYFEIRNAESDAVAATFLVRSTLFNPESQQLIGLPQASAWQNSQWAMSIPAQGLPRSLKLAEPSQIDYETVASSVVDNPVIGMMSGRREGVVRPEDCDAQGRLKDELDVMFLIARQHMQASELSGDKAFGPPVQTDSQGRRFSWAMMETRSVQFARPNLGDSVVSLGADVAFSDRWRHSRRWTFVAETGQLLGIADSLGICIDLDARKALPIPPELIGAIEQHAVPHLV